MPAPTEITVWYTVSSGLTANPNVDKNSKYTLPSNPLLLSKLTVIIRQFFIRHRTFGFSFEFIYFIWDGNKAGKRVKYVGRLMHS